MTQNPRKFFGTILLLVSTVVFAVLGTAIYANFLAGAAWWILIPYFAATGMLWFFPAAWIIRWMAKP